MTEGPGLGAVEGKFDAPLDARGSAALDGETSAFLDGDAADKTGLGGIHADGDDARSDHPGELTDRFEEASSLLDAVAGALAAPDP